MNINISIEARMTSSRLPGKVLKKINNIPALELMYKRIKNTKYINNIIIATTTNKTDDVIVLWCKQNNIKYFRGNEENVYDRVLKTHIHFKSDIIVELTGDCPLLESLQIEECIESYLNNDYDYISNDLEESYPIGLGVQVYSLNTLKSISQNRVLQYQDKEHVTPYLYTSNNYKIHNIKANEENTMPKLSITLDTIEDFRIIENICQNFSDIFFTTKDIISYVKDNPEILELNKDIKRKGLN